MIMNKHILFYSHKCDFCTTLTTSITNTSTQDNYKFISVDNPSIKIPEIITKVPTLIVRGMNKPLVGKEVFSWIKSQQFMNLSTNNINKNTTNPTFKSDNTLANTIDINYVSLNGTDDEMNKRIVKVNKFNDILITDDINKVIKDHKINQELQNSKLSQLLNNRTLQIETILNLNKSFN